MASIEIPELVVTARVSSRFENSDYTEEFFDAEVVVGDVVVFARTYSDVSEDAYAHDEDQALDNLKREFGARLKALLDG